MDKELEKDIAVETEAEGVEDEKARAKAEKEAAKKKKKEKYPTKTSINLYYKDDKTAKPATLMLYGLFALVILLAVFKFGVYDMIQENNKLKESIEEQQDYADTLMFTLRDYNDVNAQYNMYTKNYLKSSEKLQDRIEIFNMLEKTVFAQGNTSSVLISDDSIMLIYTGLDLEETAALKLTLEGYDMVSSVSVQSASLSTDASSGYETVSTTMVVKLAPVSKTGGAK